MNDVVAGAELQNILPYAKLEIEQMQKAVVNNVLSALNGGTLTPDMAQQKWIEYASYTRLLQKFEQKVRLRQSQREQIGDNLDFKRLG